MTAVRVSLVDVYPVRQQRDQLQLLVLRRAPGGPRPGTFEAVHGHIDPGETPAIAARRELLEETGLRPERLYNLSRVELFFQAQADEVSLVPVFVAMTEHAGQIALSAEHDEARWLPFEEARAMLTWPRSVRALGDIERLLPHGHAGILSDVLLMPDIPA